jgi:protein-S-isoprenylcysteine O-methyltransferase Ste14
MKLELIIFIVISIALVWVSRNTLQYPNSHGFYRFFVWECILALVLLNLRAWSLDPLASNQLISWLLLLVTSWLPIHAVRQLKNFGKPSSNARTDKDLFDFEKTTVLISSGAFRYIRHPMYATLLFLAWAAYLKQFSWIGTVLVMTASILLFLTAKREEEECLQYFGAAYLAYMQKTKRFIPFVL